MGASPQGRKDTIFNVEIPLALYRFKINLLLCCIKASVCDIFAPVVLWRLPRVCSITPDGSGRRRWGLL